MTSENSNCVNPSGDGESEVAVRGGEYKIDLVKKKVIKKQEATFVSEEYLLEKEKKMKVGLFFVCLSSELGGSREKATSEGN